MDARWVRGQQFWQYCADVRHPNPFSGHTGKTSEELLSGLASGGRATVFTLTVESAVPARLWREQDTPEGKKVFGPIQTDYLINFKDSHVTVVTFILDSWKFNDPKEQPADYVPNILSEIAAGRR